MITGTNSKMEHGAGDIQMWPTISTSRVLRALIGIAALIGGTANAMTLDHISHSTLPGDVVQIRFELSGQAPQTQAFAIDNPSRIALDFPGTSLGENVQKNQNIGVGVVRGIQNVEAAGRTRAVINLVRQVPYKVDSDGNAVVITVGQGGAGVGGEAVVAAGTGKVASRNHLKNVDFHRGGQGEGQVKVELSNPSIVTDINEEAGKIIVEFLATKLPDELERRLNVLDFATPVATIDTFSRGNNVRMEIATTDRKFQYMAYQSGPNLMVEVQPVVEEEVEAVVDEPYTGEKLSLNFQNIEVRAVLQLLADFTGMNLVTSDTVQGDITLRLKNVPWDQALDIILKARGLGMRQMGNVMMIAPAVEIAERERQELEAIKQNQELAPLYSDSIQVNYAKASDLAALLKSDKDTLLSDRGSVSIDERTNRLLVRETSENLNAIRKLVTELDIPVRQVLIDSRIVLAKDDFNKELGVRFGVSDVENNKPLGGNSSTIVSGSLDATSQIINRETVLAPDRYNVNLPMEKLTGQGGTIGLALARLPFGTLIELELQAAQAEGKSELISSPRVITANQKEALIEQGVEIPYQEQAGGTTGGTTTSFKKAVLSLRVTPQITPDDRIIMDLKVNKDNPDFTRMLNGVPPIDTQNVTTQVLVDNGETVVLGGVYEQYKAHQVSKVPFFGDLPLMGNLFRSTLNTDEKSELLIFVTPKIMKDMSAAR